MGYNNIFIIVLVLVIVYILCLSNNTNQNTEKFESKYVANDNIYLGRRRDGYDLLDDSLFNNVITYNNDDDPYECGSKLGIEKCLENCPGRCIEFGITGIGYCFPPDEMGK
jgi:hypothetical protein